MEVAPPMAVSIGPVPSTPSTPQATSIALRPIRSLSAPRAGCISMKPSSTQPIIRDTSASGSPAVLTRYFCM